MGNFGWIVQVYLRIHSKDFIQILQHNRHKLIKITGVKFQLGSMIGQSKYMKSFKRNFPKSLLLGQIYLRIYVRDYFQTLEHDGL